MLAVLNKEREVLNSAHAMVRSTLRLSESWILLVHHGGSEHDALDLTRVLDEQLRAASNNGGRVWVLHDASNMQQASEAYARVFARHFGAWRRLPVKHVAVVPKAMLRVLARLAAQLGGIDMEVYPSLSAVRDRYGARIPAELFNE